MCGQAGARLHGDFAIALTMARFVGTPVSDGPQAQTNTQLSNL